VTGCRTVKAIVLGREVYPKVTKLKQFSNLLSGGGLSSVVTCPYTVLQLISLSA